MGRTPAPPLGNFSRQVISHTLDLLGQTGHDASGRWLAARMPVSHNYVAKRLRGELPFTTTDVEAIAGAFGLSARAFVTGAVDGVAGMAQDSEQRFRDEVVDAAVAAEAAGERGEFGLAAYKEEDDTPGETDDHESGHEL